MESRKKRAKKEKRRKEEEVDGKVKKENDSRSCALTR